MLIVIHIILALAALGFALFNTYKPDRSRLKTSYGLAIGTLASGVSLIIVNHASILRTCLTGILFFGIVSILNESARHRLASQEN